MEPGDSVILTHLRRGALEHVILAMLDGEALYGLDIARRLGADDVLLSGEGLYPCWPASGSRAWSRHDVGGVDHGATSPLYSLTDDGRTALAAFRRTWTTFRDAVDAALEGGHP